MGLEKNSEHFRNGFVHISIDSEIVNKLPMRLAKVLRRRHGMLWHLLNAKIGKTKQRKIRRSAPQRRHRHKRKQRPREHSQMQQRPRQKQRMQKQKKRKRRKR